MPIKKLILLIFTLRHLKPIQFFWRIYLKLNGLIPFDSTVPAHIRYQKLTLLPATVKPTSLIDGQFVFLNHASPYAQPVNWNDAQQAKLWLYNLHYFDYLNQADIAYDTALMLMLDWIEQNPVGRGNGWEPYTLSLRVVNWIKFLSSHSVEKDLPAIQASLFVQCRFLFRHLEYHLLGNHLFKNGVALIYGGAYFQGLEATTWLQKGVSIIETEVREQVLGDGGHFERSPMYHLLILEDVLDCLNIHQAAPCFNEASLSALQEKATRMLAFAADTLHPDGDIAFFNDSALGIAPPPNDLFAYASRLGLTIMPVLASSNIDVIEKVDFGLYVLQNANGRIIIDAGAIGPDYLPGHAHCDTLSYELSLFGKRCIVNSGTYQYAGRERNDFRATAAHNTVQIDAEEQHEIWSTFRVARRGYPFDVSVIQQTDRVKFSAAHSGYQRLPGHPVHRRTVICEANSWQVLDKIEGQGLHEAQSFIHLHPAVQIMAANDSDVICHIGDERFAIHLTGGAKLDIIDSVYSPEFGLKLSNKTLRLRAQNACPFEISYTITII